MRIQDTLTTTACTDTDKQKVGAAPLYQELWWVMLERNTQKVYASVNESPNRKLIYQTKSSVKR